MRARASFRGHAVHQMLIPFPLAFLLGAVLFDLTGVLLGRPALWTTGSHLALAGVAAALLAAVPGAIDLFGSVPPASTGRTRGLRHAAANLSGAALFAAAWLLRGSAGEEPGMAVLGAEALGGVLLTMGGWMGGTLVARNQIGVDHRYAGAGKWQERRVAVPAGGGAVTLARADELERDQMMLVHLGERRLVLARTESGFAAFEDRCPHRGASLADGALICGTVQCPWHGSQFDVASGAVKAGPAEAPIRTWRVEVEEGAVRLRV